MTLEEILKQAMKKGASDVHLKAGIMPVIRKHGTLRPLAANLASLSGKQIEDMALAIMDQEQIHHFNRNKEVDIGLGISGLGRFRISIFKQRGTTRMVIRNIPYTVPSFEELRLPNMIGRIAEYERGLVLVTGATGAGKSSTLAAIIQRINQTRNKHILTIEDPIEYLIRDRKSIITQRELGVDTTDFAAALRAGLRQDPDVIFIGEMRDRETIETALVAAETGHLVLSTLHTLDARESVNRILAVFEDHMQKQVRRQLSSVLKSIVSQRLCRRADGVGFVPAVEILINNARVKDLIEDPEKTREILTTIEEGQIHGMQSFDQSLMDLVIKEIITYDEALQQSTNPEDFAIRYSGITRVEGKKWADNSHHRARIADAWHGLDEVEIEMPPKEPSVARKKKKKK